MLLFAAYCLYSGIFLVTELSKFKLLFLKFVWLEYWDGFWFEFTFLSNLLFYSLADPGVPGVALFESKSLLCNLCFGDLKLRLGSGDFILIFGDLMLNLMFELRLDLLELEFDHLGLPAVLDLGVFVLSSSNLDEFLLLLLKFL